MIVTEFHLECDSCNREFSYVSNVRASNVREIARDNGWKRQRAIDGTYVDLCEDCELR